MKSALIEIRNTAEAHGWRVHRVPDIVGNPYEWRRTHRENGRQLTEYVTVTFDVLDRVTGACWAPSLDGIGGKHALPTNKLAWVLTRLTGGN